MNNKYQFSINKINGETDDVLNHRFPTFFFVILFLKHPYDTTAPQVHCGGLKFKLSKLEH